MRQFLVLVVLGGCATDPLESHVTIDQGFYGLVRSTSDVAGYPDAVTPGVSVTVFDRATMQPLGTTKSDARGLYQLALMPGSYELCTYDAAPATIHDQWQHNCAGKCTFLDLPAARVRADWAANLSGGLWDTGEFCPQ